jgi:signal transduction histidine kinase
MEPKGFDPELFNEFFGQQPQAVIWLEPVWNKERSAITDFHYVYCNAEGLNYLGIAEKDFQQLYLSTSKTLNPELRRELMAELLQVFHSGEKLEKQVYNSALKKYAKSSRFQFRGGVLSVIQDVTAENRIIETLQHEKSFSNSILDASPDGIFAARAVRNEQGVIEDFLIQQINPAFTQILKMQQEEVIGKCFLHLFPAARDTEAFHMHVRVCTTGKPETTEVFYQQNQLDAWYYISSVKLDDGILVTFSDITEQKKNTELVEQNRNLLSNILEHSPAGISVTEVIRDEEGKITDGRTIISNDIAGAFTGIPKEVYLNKTINEIDPNIMKSHLYQQALHTLATGEPFHAQYFFEPAQRWLELSVSKMDDDHLINIFMDITSAKESQLQLERSLHELKRSNENLEEFAYAASHDLKEPIRKVLMFSDILNVQLKEKLTSEEKNILAKIEKATHRMKVLVEDLLLYSRVSQERKLEEDVDLNNKVRLVLEDLELLIREKGAIIHVGKLPVIKGHRRQLQQVFTNLITNALNYHQPGKPPEISITSSIVTGQETGLPLSKEDLQKEFYSVRVEDKGIGFAQSDAEKIFNVFTRLHDQDTKGTGVGLTIVRKVVENHQGYITAEGKPGAGAAFTVYFPVAEQSEA